MTTCTTTSTNENAEVVVVSDSVGPAVVTDVTIIDVTRLEKLYRDAVITFKKDKTNKDKRRARTKAKRLWDEATLQFCRLQEDEEEGGGDNNKSKAASAIQLRCKDCSQQFIWTSREQEYYKDPERNWIHQPQRCRLCAELQKGRRRYNNTNDTEENDEGKEEEEDDDDKKTKKKKEGKNMCYQFQRGGECRYGNECKFNHDPNFAGKPKENTTTLQDDEDVENKNENEKKRQHNNENENENSSSSSPTSSASKKKKMKTEHNHDEKEKDIEGTIISQQTCKWGKDCRLKRCRFKHNDDGDNDDTCTVITTAKTQPITGTDIDNRTDTTTVSSTNSTRKIAIDVIPTGEEVSRQEEEKQEKKKKKKTKKTKKKARHWVEEKK